MSEEHKTLKSHFPTPIIGIVTRYDDNYGACLQAAALQQKLLQLGYSAEIIRFAKDSGQHSQSVALRYIKTLLSINLKKAFFLLLSRKFVLARKRAFSEFRKDKIAFSKEQYISVVDMADLADKYDAFICGSDMIWSEEFIDSLEVYFLLFAPRSKRISYSPSFGRAILAKENVPAYRQWISEIASLSCREQSGVKLIATLTGKEATHTVDPTLLLSSDEWKEISRRSMKMQTGSPYLLTYLFSDLTNDGKALIKNICDFASLEHRCIPGKFTQYIKEKKFGIIGYGPYEFINIYSNASFIVTSTYHGLVFAIIFNKPFIVLKREDSGKWAKYDDRLVDLLVKLGLEERYVSQKTPFDSKWLTLDYSQVNRTIEQWRSDSVDYLKNALISATNISNTTNVKQIMNLESKNPPIDNYSMEECVGCGACSQICPVSSISMTANYEGFLYPECDYSICISCGMCNKVCQINHVLKGENKRPKKNLVAISRIKDIWKSAASGGVAGTFAAYAVNNMNALVFGCILNANIVAEHISITKSCEIKMIQGSKYVQSNIDNSYKIALNALQHEQNVLFFGTPCQIAGLQNFLGKKYAKLITVDHVCHGVPSPSFFKKCTDYYAKQSNIKLLKFRRKVGIPRSHSVFCLNIEYENGKIIKVPAKCDAYYSLFMKGMDFRESCYNCKFATIERCSDITIGDCDSAREYPKFKKGFSKSIILLNTVKAEIFWNSVMNLFDYRVLDLASEVEKNEQLRKPYDRPPTRDIIYQEISIMPYDRINRKYAISYGYKQKLSVFFQDLLPNWLYRDLLAVISRQQ